MYWSTVDYNVDYYFFTAGVFYLFSLSSRKVSVSFFVLDDDKLSMSQPKPTEVELACLTDSNTDQCNSNNGWFRKASNKTRSGKMVNYKKQLREKHQGLRMTVEQIKWEIDGVYFRLLTLVQQNSHAKE